MTSKMPLQRSPPPPSQKTQAATTPTAVFSTPQPLLYTPHCSSEPNLNLDADSPVNNISPAITFRNVKRKRLEEGEESRLSTFMSDMKEMFRQLKEQQEEKYDKLYSLVDQIRENVDLMATRFDQLTSRVELLETECKEKVSYINKLETKLEYFEQSTRSTCLEFRNIPVNKLETKCTLLNTVIKTGSVMDLEIQPSEIKDVFRIKSKDPANKTIIVDFTTVLRKEEFLTRFRKHIRDSFKLTTEHLKIAGPAKPIYISENLSARNKRLFFLARDAAKSNDYKFCWVKHGKIFVREKVGSKHIEVKSEADLADIQKAT